MKLTGVLILLALSVFIISPLSIQVSPSDKGTCIAALDVCHAAGSAVSLNADAPAVLECPCGFHPLELSGLADISNRHFHPNVLFSRLERPPKS